MESKGEKKWEELPDTIKKLFDKDSFIAGYDLAIGDCEEEKHQKDSQ